MLLDYFIRTILFLCHFLSISVTQPRKNKKGWSEILRDSFCIFLETKPIILDVYLGQEDVFIKEMDISTKGIAIIVLFGVLGDLLVCRGEKTAEKREENWTSTVF